MKKLFLASNGYYAITKGLSTLFPNTPSEQVKLAYITTASKGVDDLQYIEDHKKLMNDLGYDFEELDIEGKNENELRTFLKNKDAVYIGGGNTFYLLKTVRKSGFDRVIKNLVEKGLVYIGSSAGAHIACPTIETSSWKVSEKDIKNNYGVIDLTGLNLVPFLLKVHYKPEQKEMLKEKIEESKYPVKILADGQALLIEDGEIKFIGKDEEVLLE